MFFTIPFPTHRVCMGAKLLPSCPTLCNPMDCTPPGSSVHGILQARILECVAMPSSRDLLKPGIRTCLGLRLLQWQAGSFPLVPPGKPSLDIIIVRSLVSPLVLKVSAKIPPALWATLVTSQEIPLLT